MGLDWQRNEPDGKKTGGMDRDNSSYFETRFRFRGERRNLWPVLVRFLQRYIPKDSRILDIGAGYGDFINHVQAREKHALDIWPQMGEHVLPDVVVHLRPCSDMSHFPDGYFDLVFASNLFEHLERDEFLETLREIRRILREGGRLIIIQPNFRYCFRSYYDDYTHLQVFTDRSLGDLLRALQWRVTTLLPRFLPFSLKAKLPKSAFLLRLYLLSPLKPLAGQMLVIAEKGE